MTLIVIFVMGKGVVLVGRVVGQSPVWEILKEDTVREAPLSVTSRPADI